MIKRLSALALLLVFAGSSASGISPHLDGEGGCSMACCKAAHTATAESVFAKLCCKLGCNLPAGTQSSSAIDQFSRWVRPMPAASAFNAGLHAVIWLMQARFPYSSIPRQREASWRFLETGALLI